MSLVIALLSGDAFSQSTSVSSVDIVSIRPSEPRKPGAPPVTASVEQRPDGRVALIDFTPLQLVERAYPASLPREIANVPEWARRERYDVRATSALMTGTREHQLGTLRTILGDRFKLQVRVEKGRAHPTYNLILLRRDGTLGLGMKPVNLQCPEDHRALAYGDGGVRRPPDPLQAVLKTAPPPCIFRIVAAPMRDRYGDGQGRLGDLLEGTSTMAMLADMLRWSAARMIFDRTGLQGAYRLRLNFDNRWGLQSLTGYREPPGPSVFRAVEEQLGLKLESSAVLSEKLIIDRLERPLQK